MEESIPESHNDVVTTAAKFPHDDVEEDLEENDDKSAKAKLISMTTILMICTNILCTRQIFKYRIIGFCFVIWPLGQYHYIYYTNTNLFHRKIPIHQLVDY